MTTGEKIAALRRAQGLSQEALGEKLGLSRQAVSKWEADQAIPTMDNLVELGRLFGVPVDTLLRPDEPLPDHAHKPEGTKLSAEGLKISDAPILTRKTKWFIMELAALMLISVLVNIYTITRVKSLETQLQALQALPQASETGDAVQQDSVEADALSNYDIAYDMRYQEGRALSTTLTLALSARPKECRPDAETPKFTIQSAGESWTCAAILEQDNSYVGRTEIPMRDAFTVYLTLTDKETGETRNLLLDTVSGVENEFRLQWDYSWKIENDTIMLDGCTIREEEGKTAISGTIGVRFYNPLLPDGGVMRCYPVKMRLELRQGDSERNSTAWITPQRDAENGCYSAQCPVDWSVDVPLEELQLVIEYADNYGRVTEWATDMENIEIPVRTDMQQAAP